MKKTIFIIFFTLLTNFVSSQNYDEYYKIGVNNYNKKEYLTALENFDLANKLATSQTQKDNVKEYKTKCLNAAKQQKIFGRSISKSRKRTKKK